MSLLGGASALAFRFESVGDGFDDCEITDVREVQQRDHDSSLPLFWPAAGSASRRPTTDSTGPNGQTLDPVMQLRITVDTKVVDPTVEFDDGLRSVYLRAQSLSALRADLRRTRSRDVLAGGRLSMRLVDEEKVDPATGKRRGIAKKIYTVTYEPPASVPLAVDDPWGEPGEPGEPVGHQERLRAAAGRAAERTAVRDDDEPPF